METPTPVNHVFVDFENVQKIDPAVIGVKSVSFTLLMGARQTKLDLDVVEQLLRHAASVELIRLKSSGKNALDFALAHFLGRATATHPADFFHIVSKDTGFDPLVEFLRSRNVRIHRHESFATLTFGYPAAGAKVITPSVTKSESLQSTKARLSKPPLSDSAQKILDSLCKSRGKPPARKKTLLNYLGNKIPQAEVEAVLDELVKARFISINEKDAVTYKLPSNIPF